MFCTRVVPSENVANISASATVLEGVSRSRNALLNGNTRDYDWESGYTCHQLGSGCIVVQLAQPYIISSMRYAQFDVGIGATPRSLVSHYFCIESWELRPDDKARHQY